MPFTTLTDEEEKEMWRLSRLYWKEALRCERAKAHRPGCVILGSALETLLILMINCFSDEAELTGRLTLKKGVPKPPLDWQLVELLRVARAAKWLPAALNPDDDWDSRKARIGDCAELVRMVRNLAHPARYLKDHYRKRVTKKYLQRQFELVLLCRDWLSTRNNKALLEHMKAEGTRSRYSKKYRPVFGADVILTKDRHSFRAFHLPCFYTQIMLRIRAAEALLPDETSFA
jgi:hypothetical protein